MRPADRNHRPDADTLEVLRELVLYVEKTTRVAYDGERFYYSARKARANALALIERFGWETEPVRCDCCACTHGFGCAP